MSVYSSVSTPTRAFDTRWARRRRVRISETSQAQVMQYTVIDTANLKGLSHAGAPTMLRSSTTSPMAETTVMTAIDAAQASIGRCQVRYCPSVMVAPRCHK